MEKLIEFLTSKIGYTLLVIFGFLFPGLMFIFVWNSTYFIQIDVIKLILLSIGITFMIFIPNFIAMSTVLMIKEKLFAEKDEKQMPVVQELIIMPIVATVAEMVSAMFKRIGNKHFTIYNFVNQLIAIITIGFIAVLLVNGVLYMRGVIKEKKKRNIKIKIKK